MKSILFPILIIIVVLVFGYAIFNLVKVNLAEVLGLPILELVVIIILGLVFIIPFTFFLAMGIVTEGKFDIFS